MTDAPQVVARPLNDRVLIKVLDPQKGSTQQLPTGMLFLIGGGHQVEKEELAPARGVIVAVGPGYVVPGVDARHYVEMDVKVSDEVLFFEDRGMKVKINDEELILLNESFILVVLDSMDGRPAVFNSDDEADL